MADAPFCGCGADGHKPDVDLAYEAATLADRLRVIADAAVKGTGPENGDERDGLVRELRKLNEFLDGLE
ncbi:MAG: hypothetical protein HQL33_07485 [Alphaproteobacteria bacterium]|nr:hypothetical protein [Alphaproteobacteria bacterium]MBF0129819.1 hypothetical protein [Alphaproteobacteria bacterium]